MSLKDSRYLKWVFISSVSFALIFIYKNYNPNNSEYSEFFPKCPVKLTTGLDCPGCGSQRVVHNLLNLDFNNALNENPLIVFLLPYIFLLFLFQNNKQLKRKYSKTYSVLFGRVSILILIFVIIFYGVCRNL